jgi:uncharacterized Tic20 family protein
MENANLSKPAISFGLSLALASVVNGLLVVTKEKIPAVMAGMQKLTGHHWVTHALVVLGVFALFGWIFARANGGQGFKPTADRLIGTLVAGVATGSLIILGFYLIGD